MTYYGLAGSLVLFFQSRLDYDNADADVQYSIWSGFCYVTPLFGGWLADSYLGRYNTILILCALYLSGLVLMVFGAIPGAESEAVIYPGLYIIAFGTGGIKPNVSTFGADQFDDDNEQDKKEKESFFNWFYWSINLGALISYTLVAYICQYGIAGLGGEDWGFFIGFIIPAVSMALAILAFYSGTPKFTIKPPSGSILSAACGMIFEAAVTRRNEAPEAEYWLHRASRRYNGSYPDSLVKGMSYATKLAPFLMLLVPYWLCYSQMSTTFQNQGCQMDLSFGGADIPVSALNLFDTVAILMLVPVFDMVVFPAMKASGAPVSMLQKIGWGFVFAILAMGAAAVVEVIRKSNVPEEEYTGLDSFLADKDHISACKDANNFDPRKFQSWYSDRSLDEPTNCWSICSDLDADGSLSFDCIECDPVPQAASLSVLWQVPQFLLVGTSEILASVTAMEFFYSQTPSNMRSISAALNLLTTALGSWATIPLVLVVNANKSDAWVPDDLNKGHLEQFFVVIVAIMVVNLAAFMWFAKGYKYVKATELKALAEEDDDHVEVTKELRSENEGGGDDDDDDDDAVKFA
uniref:Major facilitator superfamily (MFS) profile domain-containing protein n=1 Tax=Pinguiococcus pyrenoidosus TaxID=172671 RepID=A0A7R9UH25_9STRA